MEPYIKQELTEKVNSVLWAIGSEPRALLAGAVLLEQPQLIEDMIDAYHAWSGKRDSRAIRRNLTDCLQPLGIAVHNKEHDAVLTGIGAQYAKPLAIAALYFAAETGISLIEIFPQYSRSQRHLPRARNTAEILIQLSYKMMGPDEIVSVIETRKPSTATKENLLQYELDRLKKAHLFFYIKDVACLTQRGHKAAELMRAFADALQDKPALNEMRARALELTVDITTKAMETYRRKSPHQR